MAGHVRQRTEASSIHGASALIAAVYWYRFDARDFAFAELRLPLSTQQPCWPRSAKWNVGRRLRVCGWSDQPQALSFADEEGMEMKRGRVEWRLLV